MAFSDFRSKEFFALLGLALLLRISFLTSYGHLPVSDEKDYLELASGLADSGSYSIAGTPTAFRPPGYPAFLAAVRLIVGPSLVMIRVFQVFLDIGIVAGLYALGINHGRVVAILAGLLWALFPPAILYTGLVLSETFSAFVLVALLVTLTSGPRPAGVARTVAAGLLAGILILVKAWMVPFAAGILIHLWIRTRSRPVILLFSAGILLVITPWIIRNVMALGSPLISTNTGINLYMGNNPYASGAYKAGLPDTLLAASHDELEFHRLSLALAVRHIVQDPAAFIKRIPVKIAHIFRSEGELMVWAFHPNIRDKSSSFSDKYRTLPVTLILGVNILYACILIAGIAGVLSFRHDELTSLTIMFSGILLAVHAIFFGGSRFHFLLMPLMTLFAARMLPNFRLAWTAMTVARRAGFIVVTSLLLSVWILEFLYVF